MIYDRSIINHIELKEHFMSEILLQTGTGEVEIVQFIVSGKHYAINVLKVKGIVPIEDVTPIPKSGDEIAGIANIRGEMNTVIDLRVVLHGEKTQDYTKVLGLLCEFNESVVVFLVDKVEGIKRIKWGEIKQNNELKDDTLSIGNILSEDTIIVLLDFESIAIAARIGRGYEREQQLISEEKKQERHERIVLAEDSRAIREMLKCALTEAGYKHLKLFSNGQEAYEYMMSLKDKQGEKVREKIDLIITDIEMPLLDGYTLTKYIKEDELLKTIPVVIFSSLITEEMQHRGQSVGADIQISKPSMKELVETINKLLK